MPDYRVTFKGDLGNLAQFDAAIRNSVTASARAIEQANKSLLSQVGNFQGLFNPDASGAGQFYKGLKTEIDGVNRTFVQSGQAVRRVISDYELAFDKAKKTFSIKENFVDLYESPYKQRIGDLDKFEDALKRVAPTEQKILADQEATLKRQIPLRERLVKLEEQRGKAVKAIEDRQGVNRLAEYPLVERRAQAKKALALIDPTDVEAVKAGQRVVNGLNKELSDTRAKGRVALEPLKGILSEVDAKIDATTAKIERMNVSLAGRAAGLRGLNPAYADLDAASKATPPIQRDLAAVLRQSEDLRKNLLKAGLGAGTQYGTDDFQRALAAQEAQVSRYTNNLRTNVATVQGEFKNLQTGVMQQFTVDLDKQGKVIGRWGGQLAGAGTFLRQTVRDFQKVIEWTIATTVVFGALATAIGQLKSINDLNTSLTRLSITAQTTSQQTENLFEGLAEVAIQTATPLNEIVSAADDISLATRQAGDSMEEWMQKTIDLTRAVGIFTNLTGTDTVEATDQLSAAFKQLGVEPENLIGILNKVTAVAGGQSTAINDIVKSLAGLSEAAKAAGLSVDEQIASIQVLSQVTNKSSDEVATAFKNLFGAVSSVGSEKILKTFGIEIRDASGGLRDFLDIYRDIKDALDAGIIPQNRLPDVLRGIAGGPRRAPDAAALLGNLDKVFAVVEKSAGATNEALIANAKILDTNAAKIQQFQNAVDIAIFQKFGAVVKDLTETLTSFGTTLFEAFNGIDTNLVSVLVKLGGVLLLVKGFGAALKLTGITAFASQLRVMATEFLGVSKATGAATAQLTLFNEAQLAGRGSVGSGARGIIGGLSRNKGILAGLGLAGAGLAAGATAGSTGIDTNTIGALAGLGGSIALLIPGLQAVGVGLIGGSIALQAFGGDSSKAAKSQEELTSEVLTLTDALKAAQDSANGFATAQREADQRITNIQASAATAAEKQALLTAATEDYVTATLGLADANKIVNDTFNDLIKTLPGLSEKYEKFVGITRLTGANSSQIKELREQLVQDLLRNSGQGIYAGTPLKVSPTFTAATGGDSSQAVAKTLRESGLSLPEGFKGHINIDAAPAVIDLIDLLKNPRRLTELFDTQTGAAKFDIPRNDLSVSYLQSALTEIGKNLDKYGVSPEQFDVLSKAINELAAATSTFAQNAAAIEQTKAGVQASTLLGEFTAQQTDNANLATKLLEQIFNAQKNAPRIDSAPSVGNFRQPNEVNPAVQALQKNFADVQTGALAGLPITNQTLIEIATNTLKAASAGEGLGSVYDQLKEKGDEALNKGIYTWLQNSGVGTEQLSSLAQALKQDLEDVNKTIVATTESFDNARKSAASAFGNRQLQLLIAENSGDFDKNAAGLKKLREQNRAALEANNALIDSMEKLSDSALVDLNQQLSNIIGLQGQYLTATELNSDVEGFFAERVTETTGKLLENAVAAGVNADGIVKIQDEVLRLIALAKALDAIPPIILEIQTQFKTLSPLQLGTGDTGKEMQTRLNQAYRDQATAQTSAKDIYAEITKIINKALNSGTGGDFGRTSGSKTKKAAIQPDVSQIDLPEEIANATNRSALIQEAIRRARALQRTIPGATKEASNDIVSLLKGTQNILNVRGIKDDLLRRALEELADVEKKRLEFETKADTIRRIRIGNGSFAAIANVPVNSRTGVSLGGPSGPINVTLNINGTILTPAQLGQFADLIASSLKRQIANG